MLQHIFQTIGVGAVAVITAIVNLITPTPLINELENQISDLQIKIEQLNDIQLGSYNAVSGKYYRLWGSGHDTDDTSIILQSFKIPVSDIELEMTDFGSIGYGVIEPDNVSNVEFISFSGITQDGSSDKATLTGVVRGLNFVSPYNASTTLAKAHSGGSRFIISNPAVHYEQFATKDNAEYIWGDWTFSATSTPQYSSEPSFTSGSSEFASVKYAENLANAGAANASTTIAGIVEIADSNDLINFSTTTGESGRIPVIPMELVATSTDKRGATTTLVVTDTDGTIDLTFFPLTETIAWTGENSYSATTTFTNDIDADGFDLDSANDLLTITASTTINASTTFTAIPTIPSVSPYESTQVASKGYVDAVFATSANATGVASSSAIQWSDDTERLSATSAESVKIKEVLLSQDLATTSIKWDMKPCGTIAAGHASSTVYKNGVAIGSWVTANNDNDSYVTYWQEFTNFKSGDLIQIYGGNSDGRVYIQNLRFYFNWGITSISGYDLATDIAIVNQDLEATNQDP